MCQPDALAMRAAWARSGANHFVRRELGDLWINEPVAVCQCEELAARVYSQRAVEALDVIVDRVDADAQRARRVGLVQAAADQGEHLLLAG